MYIKAWRNQGLQMLTTNHAAQRGRDAFGTATRISASLSRRLSASFRSVSDQDPKAAKFAVLTPGPGMLVNVRNAPRVVIPPPTQNTTCFTVCALVCDFSPKAECVPAFTRESERGPFVREVENRDEKRFETAL